MTNEQLRDLRYSLNLSPREMARLMGITLEHNYLRLESGRRPLTLQHERIVDTIQFVAVAGLLPQLLER